MLSAQALTDWLFSTLEMDGEFIPIPCPDGIPGCLVAHYSGNWGLRPYLTGHKRPFKILIEERLAFIKYRPKSFVNLLEYLDENPCPDYESYPEEKC